MATLHKINANVHQTLGSGKKFYTVKCIWRRKKYIEVFLNVLNKFNKIFNNYTDQTNNELIPLHRQLYEFFLISTNYQKRKIFTKKNISTVQITSSACSFLTLSECSAEVLVTSITSYSQATQQQPV